MEDEFLWFYRSDNNPTANDNQAEWTSYEKDNENIEIAYQRFLFALESEDQNEIKELSNYNLNEQYQINFLHNVQMYGDKQRLIGRFCGNIKENKQLKNLLSSKIYRWYLSSNDNSPVWTPFRIDENDKIETQFKKFSLSKGSNIYEGQYFKIDFNLFSMTYLNDLKTVKVSRKNDSVVNEVTNETNKKVSEITTISEKTIKSIQKEYFLNFKNIFPLKILYEQQVKFYWKQESNSIIVRIYQKINEDASNPVLDLLIQDGFQEMCELIKTKDTNEFEVKFKIKIPFQLMGRVSKSNWYYKYNEGSDEFWQQFSKDENIDLDIVYKKRFLQHHENKISYGIGNKRKLIEFNKNEYYSFNENGIFSKKTILRFYPKYSNPDEITRITVPEEVFTKMQKETMTDSPILYANKLGPKTFNELINEIKKELKNESVYLNDVSLNNIYEEKYLNNINQKNFPNTIIKIYTEEGFVYRRVNKVLRDKQYDAFWNFKYYYFSLLYSLEKIQSQRTTLINLYRGLSLKPEQQEFYLKNLKESDMILFNEFLSTTSDKAVALNYAKSDGLLFEIEVSKEAAKRIANIENFSAFSHEKEVLLSSGSILKYIGKSERQDNLPAKIMFSLLESNSKAFFNFISSYEENTIDLSKLNLDYPSIEGSFQGANNNSNINRLLITINDSSLLYLVAKSIMESKSLNYIQIKKKGEMNNNKMITINFERTINLKRTITIEIINFYENDYKLFLNEILEQNAVISYFKAKEIYESAFDLFINKQKNLNTLNYLQLYRISNDSSDDDICLTNTNFTSLKNLGQMISFNKNLTILKLNLNNSEELKIITDSLINNSSIKKIKLTHNEQFLTRYRINIKKNNHFLKIDLTDFDTENFEIFLMRYLIKENKINELKLSNNLLFFSIFQLLTKFLSENDTLEYLELVRCSINDQYLLGFSEALEKNNTLKRVNLQNNHLTNKSKTTLDFIINKGISLNLNYNYLDDFKPKSKSNSGENFKCIETLIGHDERIFSLIKLSDGKLASGSFDCTIRIWDPNDNYKCIKTIEVEDDFKVLSKLSNNMIALGLDCKIKILDPNDNYKCIKTLEAHEKSILTIIQLKDNKIVSGSEDNTIIIWDTNNNFEIIKILKEHEDRVNRIIELNDGKIVSGSDDGTIRIWDPKNNFECIKSLKNKKNDVRSLYNLSNGMFVSGSIDKSIKIWNPKNNFINPKSLKGHDNCITSLIELRNGMIVSASDDKTLKIWDSHKNYELNQTLRGHKKSTICLIELSNGMIASGSDDETIKIWDSNDYYEEIKIIQEDEKDKEKDAEEEDEDEEEEDDEEEEEEDEKENKKENEEEHEMNKEKNEEVINVLLKLSDGKIISGSNNKTIKIFDPNYDFKFIKSLKIHEESVKIVIQLRDGKIVSGSDDKTIKIWDTDDDYKLIQTLQAHDEAVLSLIELSNGMIASGSNGTEIKLWDPSNNYNCYKTLDEHFYSVNVLLKLSDGKLLSGSNDYSIKIWDQNDNFNSINTLELDDAINSVIQLYNNLFIVSGSDDGKIKIWDTINDFEYIKTLSHEKSITSLMKLNGGYFVSGSVDKMIKIWDPNNDFECIYKFEMKKQHVTSLIELSDGKILSGSSKNRIIIWENHGKGFNIE